MLSDGQKRAAYDQYGHAGVDPNMGGAGAQGFGGFADAFGDIFGDIFGRAAGGARAAAWRPAGVSRRRLALQHGNHARAGRTRLRHADPRAELGVVRGLPRVGCEARHEAGNLPDLSRLGTVRMSQGFFSIQQTCPKCHGTGTYIPEPCVHCHGSGKVKETKTLEVKIPAGIDDGMRIRSAGNGEPGINGGPPGDLYVEIHIKPHSVFERDGDDLHCQMPIPFTTAALGGEISADAGRPCVVPGAGGHAVGQDVPPARQGASRGCVRASRAICTSTCGSRRR